jgi:hypothetical protein
MVCKLIPYNVLRKTERQIDRKSGMNYRRLVFRVLLPAGYKEMSFILADQ